MNAYNTRNLNLSLVKKVQRGGDRPLYINTTYIQRRCTLMDLFGRGSRKDVAKHTTCTRRETDGGALRALRALQPTCSHKHAKTFQNAGALFMTLRQQSFAEWDGRKTELLHTNEEKESRTRPVPAEGSNFPRANKRAAQLWKTRVQTCKQTYVNRLRPFPCRRHRRSNMMRGEGKEPCFFRRATEPLQLLNIRE